MSWPKTGVKRCVLSLPVFHGDAALKKIAAVIELSPGRLFHLLVVPSCRSRALKFATSTRNQSVTNISNYSSRWELITIIKSQERRTFLLDDRDSLKTPYLQRCTTHSSVNFISVFSTEQAVSILARKTEYYESGFQSINSHLHKRSHVNFLLNWCHV